MNAMNYLNSKLQNLHESIGTMFTIVESTLKVVTQSFRTGLHESDQVREFNKRIDALELEIDKNCIALLVSERLYGTDLRHVYTAGKTVKDLERVGDECGNIMRFMRNLKAPKEGSCFAELTPLSDLSLQMFYLAQEAFLKDKFLGMRALVGLEIQVDQLADEITEKSENKYIVLMARSLERVGDLSTNLAENVIYNVKGKDIRHGHFESLDVS